MSIKGVKRLLAVITGPIIAGAAAGRVASIVMESLVVDSSVICPISGGVGGAIAASLSSK